MRTGAVLVSIVSAALWSATSSTWAQEAARVIASTEDGWPQWRGPRRDGVSAERGLLQQWPEAGLRNVWSIGGLGKGYGSPIIVGDTIFIAGDVGKDLVVFAFDLAGKEKWRTTNGKCWSKSHPGARGTACYDNGRLYLMNAHGRLACIGADDGAEIWAVNVLERFEAKNITWGISESVLVHGNAVFVTPVGKKALMAALNKQTGATLWTTDAIPGEQPTYSAPILVEVRGRKQLISCGTRHVFAVDAAAGALLWKHPQAIPDWVVGASPVFSEDSVYVSNATKDIGRVFRLRITGDEPNVAWTAELGNTYAGNVVCTDGVVFGSRKREIKGWVCLDAKTGDTRYADLDTPSGSVVYADGRFYCLTDRGVVSLVDLSEQGLETLGRMAVVQGKTDVWSHPVICNGRLYIRYHDQLHCYDVRK